VKLIITRFDEHDLNKDGIHLKKQSLGILRNLIKEALKETSENENDSLDFSPILTPTTPVNDGLTNRKRTRQDAEMEDDMGPNVTDRQIQLELLRSLKRLESKFDNETSNINKEQAVQAIKIDNNMVAIARVKEELDGVQNFMKRHQIILRNITIPHGFVMPKDRKDQAETIRMLTLTEVSKLKPIVLNNLSITSIYILPVGGSTTTFNDYRITCGSPDEAMEVKQ